MEDPMVAINDLAELNILIDTPSGREENVLGFKATATTATLDGLAADFQANFLAQWMATSSNAVTCSRLDVVDVWPGTAATVVHTVSPAQAGAISGELLPPQSAAVFSYRTPLKGRSFRGRSFHGQHCEVQQNDGVWTATPLAAWDTLFDNYLARYGIADPVAHWRACVISRFNAGVKRVAPIGTFITDISVEPFVFSMRRRAQGR